MTIHVIGTVNGIENEGMRNVATHLSRYFEKHHTVLYSGMKDVRSILRNTGKSNITIVFARANKMVYWLMRMIELFHRPLWLVIVQRPESAFLQLQKNRPVKCGFLTLLESDIRGLRCAARCRTSVFQAGINPDKFIPVSEDVQRSLKQKYGFDPEKKLVVHVGHCSAGRGLEDFTAIDPKIAQTMVVASGLFENAQTVTALEKAGVRIQKGYLEHVEEIYQMADVYFFPTRSSEFVISIPLSVMEALACGTPVIGYGSFGNLFQIGCKEGAMAFIRSADEINRILDQDCVHKEQHSLLLNTVSWDESAKAVLNVLKEEIK